MKRVLVLMTLLLTLLLSACSSVADAPQTQPEPTEASDDAAAPVESTSTTGSEPAAPAANTPAATDPVEAPEAQAGSVLAAVKERGQVICGYNGTLPGFGNIDSDGNITGFDADFCRAVAAAALGDGEAVEFRPLNAQERFTALQTGEVDVLIRNSTWTISRDSELGLDWAPVNFYDGQGMMVRADSGIESLADMDGATICVQTGTTTELNLADNFRSLDLEFTPVVFSENDQVVAAYDAGQCDGFTTDKSGLVASTPKLSSPEDHIILPDTMSKEPLAPAVRQGDPQWKDIVSWAVFATIQAEEYGITSENVEEFLENEDPGIRRFLGVEGELGSKLGVSDDFTVSIIRAVGNYGEIYDRNLGPDTPFNLPRGQNQLFTEEGGLLYSPPFR